MCVIMYMWCECAGSRGGCVSWGLLWNVSARPVSEPWDGQTWNQSGKGPQRGGRRMTRDWMRVGRGGGEGRGGLSLHPRPQKAPGPTVPWKEPLCGPGRSACVGLRPQTHRLPAWYISVLFYRSLSHSTSVSRNTVFLSVTCTLLFSSMMTHYWYMYSTWRCHSQSCYNRYFYIDKRSNASFSSVFWLSACDFTVSVHSHHSHPCCFQLGCPVNSSWS